MNGNTLTPPPLTRLSAPWCVVKFTGTDGKPHAFYSAVNDMTGDRLTAFDGTAPTVGHAVSEARKIVRNIRAKAQDVREAGTLFGKTAEKSPRE